MTARSAAGPVLPGKSAANSEVDPAELAPAAAAAGAVTVALMTGLVPSGAGAVKENVASPPGPIVTGAVPR